MLRSDPQLAETKDDSVREDEVFKGLCTVDREKRKSLVEGINQKYEELRQQNVKDKK